MILAFHKLAKASLFYIWKRITVHCNPGKNNLFADNLHKNLNNLRKIRKFITNKNFQEYSVSAVQQGLFDRSLIFSVVGVNSWQASISDAFYQTWAEEFFFFFFCRMRLVDIWRDHLTDEIFTGVHNHDATILSPALYKNVIVFCCVLITVTFVLNSFCAVDTKFFNWCICSKSCGFAFVF